MMELFDKLKNYKLIMASGSPRRKELLEGMGINFTIAERFYCDETCPDYISGYMAAGYVAKVKSLAYPKELAKDEILLTADTLVMLGDKVLGKPKDRDEAIAMLKKLSGREHLVMTGVALRSLDKIRRFTASTLVYFRELTIGEIEYYVDNFKPYDKAGAYGIQQWLGSVAITKIEGSYYNVMGLPTERLYKELAKFV